MGESPLQAASCCDSSVYNRAVRLAGIRSGAQQREAGKAGFVAAAGAGPRGKGGVLPREQWEEGHAWAWLEYVSMQGNQLLLPAHAACLAGAVKPLMKPAAGRCARRRECLWHGRRCRPGRQPGAQGGRSLSRTLQQEW